MQNPYLVKQGGSNVLALALLPVTKPHSQPFPFITHLWSSLEQEDNKACVTAP